ncbi:hypothetical protein YB2330_003201 [Saitoella coloradoensis]
MGVFSCFRTPPEHPNHPNKHRDPKLPKKFNEENNLNNYEQVRKDAREGIVCGPLLKYSHVDYNAGTWNGTVLIVVREREEGAMGQRAGLSVHDEGRAQEYQEQHRSVYPQVAVNGTATTATYENMSGGNVTYPLNTSAPVNHHGHPYAQPDAGTYEMNTFERHQQYLGQGPGQGYGLDSATASSRPYTSATESTFAPSYQNGYEYSAAGSSSHQQQSHTVQPDLIHREGDHYLSFYRYHLSLPLSPGNASRRVTYRIPLSRVEPVPSSTGTAAVVAMHVQVQGEKEAGDDVDEEGVHVERTFWVAGSEEEMRIAFHSCNGFSSAINPKDFGGPDPLWKDLYRKHEKMPFHVLLGGGDQIYCDGISRASPLFGEWLSMSAGGSDSMEKKIAARWTEEMRVEVETYYLWHYVEWFGQGIAGKAMGEIPGVNIWDDHDIIDGFGSYPHEMQMSEVLSKAGTAAHKYYTLFQHHSTLAECQNPQHTPAGTLFGNTRGPYIKQLPRHVFTPLGPESWLLGLDCRTERRRDKILSEGSYAHVFDHMRKYVQRGDCKHLIVLLGVPIAYPRTVWLERILTSRLMDPVKLLARQGWFKGLSGLINRFDGGVEILDDLDDHWTAKHHKSERNKFLKDLQEFALEKNVRITILGGDVHLGAIGLFYSNPKLGLKPENDHRWQANIISSAIVNAPPGDKIASVLARRNKVHHLDHDTDEIMQDIFTHNPQGKELNNTCLLPCRNWCSILPRVEEGGLDIVLNAEKVQGAGEGETREYVFKVPVLRDVVEKHRRHHHPHR